MLNTYDYNAGLREARREILAIDESDPESVKTALFQVLGACSTCSNTKCSRARTINAWPGWIAGSRNPARVQ
jgi:hypothetical protein